MSDVYQIASIGMLGGRQRLQAISLNAASASVTGYRRHVAVASPFAAALSVADTAPLTHGAAQAPVQSFAQQVDLKPGAITRTGRALDLAIEAQDAFFALTDGRDTWLTRSGAFRVNADGLLVGERGLHVVGANGDIRLPGDVVDVAADGRITHEGVVVAALQLFQSNERGSLQAASGSLLIASGGIHPAEATHVRSGVLEGSNTDATREMLSLIELSRQFEGLSRILQGYDEVLGRFIQQAGES